MTDDDLRNRVRKALDKLRDDRRLKRSVKKLAKLVGCSTGTLYNHEWPVTDFKKLKLELSAPAAKTKKSIEPQPFNAEMSDQELMRWKRRCDDLIHENGALKARVNELRGQVQDLSELKSQGGNVLPM